MSSTSEVWSAVVTQVEDGFFVGQDEVPVPPQFSKRVVDGIASMTQYFRVHVAPEGVSDPSGDVWMVCTANTTGKRLPPQKPLVESDLALTRSALLTALPDATFCFTTADREGDVQVLASDGHSHFIAAAVAVIKYYASWDESDPVNVRVNHSQLAVSVTALDNAYRTLVRG
ncbi:MAG TPA: hypothetical protein VHO25_25240 [Polyangiaceae bacterium]|nr:hypothetical protein [Polyangiaceae bacterium]